VAARDAARAHRVRHAADAGRRHAGLRLAVRRGVGDPPGLERDCAYWRSGCPTATAPCAAELLQPGEVVVGEYTTPWLYAAYSDRGLDGLSAAFHSYLRAGRRIRSRRDRSC